MIFALLMAEPDLRPRDALAAARPAAANVSGDARGLLTFLEQHVGSAPAERAAAERQRALAEALRRMKPAA